MVMPSPTYRKADPGNYSSTGTAAHAHRSFTLDGAGYDLSAAPDGTLVVIWCPLGHEHNAILLEDPNRNTHIRTGLAADYDNAAALALTEVPGWTEGPWQAVAPSSVIIIHGHVIYGTLGDGTGGTINKALFTEKTGGNSDITVHFTEDGAVSYPQTDDWVTPIINIFEPNAGNNCVVDAGVLFGSSGSGDPATASIPAFTTGQDDTYVMFFGESIAGTWDSNSPAGYTPETSADGGYAMEWNRGYTTAGTYGGESVTNENSGQPDGYAVNGIGVYYEVSGPSIPTVPTSVVATAGDGEATVIWVDGTGSPTPNALVSYRVNGGSWSSDTTVANAVQTLTQSGLTNGDTIRFRVAMDNTEGTSAYVESNDVVPTAASGAKAGSYATALGGGQTLPGTSFGLLDLGTIDLDDDGILSESAGVFTPQIPGYYLILSESKFVITHNNRLDVEHEIRKNSSSIDGSADSGYARNNANAMLWVRAGAMEYFNGSSDTFEVYERRDTGTGSPAGSYSWTRLRVLLLATGNANDTPYAHYGTPTSAAHAVAGTPDATSVVSGWDAITETDTSVIELQGDGQSIRLKEANRPYLFIYGFPTDAAGSSRTIRVSDMTVAGARVPHSAGYAYQRDGANQWAAPAGMMLTRPSTPNVDAQARVWLYEDDKATFWGTMLGYNWTLSSASGRSGIMVIALPPETNIAIFDDLAGNQTYSGAATTTLNMTNVANGTVDAPFQRDNNTDLTFTTDGDVFGYAGYMIERTASSGSRQSNAMRINRNGTPLTADTEFGKYLRGEQGSQDGKNAAAAVSYLGALSTNDTLQLEKFDPGTDDGNNDVTAWGGSFWIDLSSLDVSTPPSSPPLYGFGGGDLSVVGGGTLSVMTGSGLEQVYP